MPVAIWASGQLGRWKCRHAPARQAVPCVALRRPRPGPPDAPQHRTSKAGGAFGPDGGCTATSADRPAPPVPRRPSATNGPHCRGPGGRCRPRLSASSRMSVRTLYNPKPWHSASAPERLWVETFRDCLMRSVPVRSCPQLPLLPAV